jgi:hypothetical protein
MSKDNKIIYWARLYDTREDFPGSGVNVDKDFRAESSHKTLASAKEALEKMSREIDPKEYGRVEKIEYEWDEECQRWDEGEMLDIFE